VPDTSFLQGAPPRRSANVAALLTWFVPGAGHLYVGRGLLGLAVFGVVQGLYLLGLRLSGGRVFEFLDPELRSSFAPALSPEAGNLGAILYQMRKFGFGEGHLEPWPAGIVLGSLLTAASGILNAIAMTHAHTLARTSSLAGATRPVAATLCAWLVPGLGHVLQGRKLRGAIVFVLLVGTFALGTTLSEGSNLSRERHFYYWAGQYLLGLPAIASELALGDMRITHDIPYVEAGLVFGCVAGLLNVVAMLDVYGWGEAKLFGWPPRTSRDKHAETKHRSVEPGPAVPTGAAPAEPRPLKPSP
jgi:TM2 domain-containing membrane protein YozV/predicted outer membrane lipoprotein